MQNFSTGDIAALRYPSDEAKGIHFKLSEGNKLVTEPTPVRKHGYLSLDMAERNHQIRLFLEHDDNSTIKQGYNYRKLLVTGPISPKVVCLQIGDMSHIQGAQREPYRLN